MNIHKYIENAWVGTLCDSRFFPEKIILSEEEAEEFERILANPTPPTPALVKATRNACLRNKKKDG